MLTQLFAETVPPTARLALEVQPLIVLSVCQASSPSPQLKSASIPVRLHTSPMLPLGLVISAILPAPRVSLPPPTARPAPLSTTRLQALFLGLALSAIVPVMSALAQATQPVKPAIQPITQSMDIPRPA